MTMRIRCPKCQCSQIVSPNGLGKPVHCQHCAQEFHADKAIMLDDDEPLDVLPVHEDASVAEAEPLEVVLAEMDNAPDALKPSATPFSSAGAQADPERPAAEPEAVFDSWYEEEKVPRRCFSGRVIWLCKNKATPGATVWQRVVLGNLVRWFERYDLPWLAIPTIYLLAPIMAGTLTVVGYLFMLLAYWLLSSAGKLVGDWTEDVLYIVPLLMVLFVRYLEPWMHEEKIEFNLKDGRYDGFDLGRIGDIFHMNIPALVGFFFGLLFGMQVGLIHLTRNHVGLAIEGGLWQSFLLALNNVCHGVFLDTFEIYNINLAGRIQYGFWSGSLFYAFQLGHDVLAALLFYAIYQRYALRKLLQDMPDPEKGSGTAWLDWIQNLATRRNRWSRKFFDEFLFLAMAEAFVRGQFERVRILGQQFPHLLVVDEVRRLFVGPGGESLFPPVPPQKAGA